MARFLNVRRLVVLLFIIVLSSCSASYHGTRNKNQTNEGATAITLTESDMIVRMMDGTVHTIKYDERGDWRKPYDKWLKEQKNKK